MALCVPFGYGVPVPTGPNSYTTSGPPIWWDATSGPLPERNLDLEDPRWQGSLAIGYAGDPSVVADHAQFRAVYGTEGGVTYLYLSWVIKVDPDVGSSADTVIVGFHRAGASHGPVGLRIVPTIAATAATGALPAQLRMITGALSGGSWIWTEQPAAGNPVWLADTKVWVDPSSTRRYPWAVQMRVPIQATLANGLDLGSAFRMRFEMNVVAPGATFIPHSWPRTATHVLGNDLGDPTGGDWDDVQVSGGGTCAGGVSLEWGDVGTLNTPSSKILFSSAAVQPVNTFYVRPRNTGPAVLASSDTQSRLSARFRIANWGSTPTGGTGTWVDIPEGSDVRNKPIPGVGASGAIPTNSQGDMRFNWAVNDVLGGPQFLTEFTNGTRREHQCVLVELSGPGLLFTRSSLYQNMDVQSASSFTREAEISVAGIAPVGGTHRTVYLYVQTLNMPSSLRPPSPRPDRPGGDLPDRNVVPGYVGRGDGDEGRIDNGGGNGNGDGNGNGNGEGQEGPPPEPPGPPPPPWEEETRPVHLVHVWHTTGEDVTGPDGVTRHVLEPQTSYGHYVEHDGPLFGWQHRLEGPGLVEIAPDFYRINVPNGGAVTVTTTISSLDSPDDLAGLLAWLIALLKALLRWLLRFFTRWPRRLIRAVVRLIRRLFGS